MKWLLLASLFATILLAILALADAPRVQLLAVPILIDEGTALDFQIRTPEHPDNQRLIAQAYQAGEDEPIRTSQLELDVLQDVRWYLPAGVYAIVAGVQDRSGKWYTDHKPITVRGKLDE